MSAFTVIDRPGVLKSTYPRWRYLVRGYVEALGLEPIPVRRPRRGAIGCYIGENDTLPPPGESSFAMGVRFDGCLYLREDDGLAWGLA